MHGNPSNNESVSPGADSQIIPGEGIEMTKQDLIKALSPKLIQEGHSPKDVQNVLETYTVPELQAMYRKQHGNLGKTQQDPTELQLLERIRAEARQQY